MRRLSVIIVFLMMAAGLIPVYSLTASGTDMPFNPADVASEQDVCEYFFWDTACRTKLNHTYLALEKTAGTVRVAEEIYNRTGYSELSSFSFPCGDNCLWNSTMWRSSYSKKISSGYLY